MKVMKGDIRFRLYGKGPPMLCGLPWTRLCVCCISVIVTCSTHNSPRRYKADSCLHLLAEFGPGIAEGIQKYGAVVAEGSCMASA